MKRAIFTRFIIVLLFALLLCSAVFYYVTGNHLLKTNIETMGTILRTVDYSLDYAQELQPQINRLGENALEKDSRVTVLDLTGKVYADTEAPQISLMENHLEREEIREAIETGTGYSTRRSSTLNKNLLYVARLADNGKYILRIAVPFSASSDYARALLPILTAGVAVSFCVSMILAVGITKNITRPLNEIAEEMKTQKTGRPDFHFCKYRYEEFNVIADTTVAMAEDINDYLDKLEFEKKVRQEFFSNASHELKTPITSIQGYAELLANDLIPGREGQKDALGRIIREASNMTGLINDILMISRLETKETQVDFSPVRMPVLLDDVVDSLSPLAKACGITVTVDCSQASIFANLQQIRELMSNLISNGIKYNHPGGSVRVRVREDACNLLISVSDDGMGISQEDQVRVFERFYRVDKGRSKKMGGTGLGLSIVKHIVNFYNGTIRIESEPGKGTTFLVTLPKEKSLNTTDEIRT
ncbi:sensor histidine kinase [Anaerolentibacter hominis]|uniref:sensor histidine kinase n=1 Tax=Anaerolentibacter hominis TaxID=3079009 RepID=UPI0031B80830